MPRKLHFLPLITVVLCTFCSNPEKPSVTFSVLNSNTDHLLQAISIVDENTTWISGHDATFIRTVDGGRDWKVFTYDLIDSLQFRDIHAFDEKKAVLMSAGPGIMSRIFLFNMDSGYTETYVMPHEDGFLNTIEFWDDQNGLAFGDSFGDQLFVLKTTDGGKNWSRIDPSKLPLAGEGEGGFAASGTCITSQPGGKAWIGTGAGGNARVLYTSDYGQSWQEFASPLVKGPAAGIASIRMMNDQIGLTTGGDLSISDAYTDNIALTNDGGKTWKLTNHPQTKGAFYGSDLVQWNNGEIMIISGPKGIDYSLDHGQTFTTLDTLNYWAVDLHPKGFGYAAGKSGHVIKIKL